jgi:hypothetical protein
MRRYPASTLYLPSSFSFPLGALGALGGAVFRVSYRASLIAWWAMSVR